MLMQNIYSPKCSGTDQSFFSWSAQ